MKKTILTILAVLILFLGAECQAFAENGFNVSALQNSSSFDQRGDYWSIAGEFSGMADGYSESVTVGAYLSSTYISEGWGPELRVSLKKNACNFFCEMTAFRARRYAHGRLLQFLPFHQVPYSQSENLQI